MQKKILALFMVFCMSCVGLLPQTAFADGPSTPTLLNLTKEIHNFNSEEVKILSADDNPDSVMKSFVTYPVIVDNTNKPTISVNITTGSAWSISLNGNDYIAGENTTGTTYEFKPNVEEMYNYFYIKGKASFGPEEPESDVTFRIKFSPSYIDPGPGAEQNVKYTIKGLPYGLDGVPSKRIPLNPEYNIEVRNGKLSVFMIYSGTMTNLKMKKDNGEFTNVSKISESGNFKTYQIDLESNVLKPIHMQGWSAGMGGGSLQEFKIVFTEADLKIADGDYTIGVTAREEKSPHNTSTRMDPRISKPLKLKVKDGNITGQITFIGSGSKLSAPEMSLDNVKPYEFLNKVEGQADTYEIPLGTKISPLIYLRLTAGAMPFKAPFQLVFDTVEFPADPTSLVPPVIEEPIVIKAAGTIDLENGQYTIDAFARQVDSNELSRIDNNIVRPLKIEKKDGKISIFLTLRGSSLKDIQFEYPGKSYKPATLFSEDSESKTYKMEMDSTMYSYITVKGYVEAMGGSPEFRLVFSYGSLKKVEDILLPILPLPVVQTLTDINGFKINVEKIEPAEGTSDRPSFKVIIEKEQMASPSSMKATVSLPYAPSEDEMKNAEKLIVYKVMDDGTMIVEPSGKFNAKTGNMEFKTGVGEGTYTIGYSEKSFNDLENFKWATNAVEVLAARNIITGTGNEKFDPQSNIKRADFIVMLVKAMGAEGNPSSNFSDVGSQSYYADFVGMAKELKIIGGYADGTFNPNAPISRQEMMTISANALKSMGGLNKSYDRNILAQFDDMNSISGYAMDSMAALVSEGMIAGKGKNMDPKTNVRRAEAAIIIYGIYNYDETTQMIQPEEKKPENTVPIEPVKEIAPTEPVKVPTPIAPVIEPVVEGMKEGNHSVNVSIMSSESNELSRLNNAIEGQSKIEVKDGKIYGYLTLKRSATEMSDLKISTDKGATFKNAELVTSEKAKTVYKFELENMDEPVLATMFVEAMGISPKFRISFDKNSIN